MAIPFVKGQMGGNRIVLLDGRAVAAERAREVALAALSPEGLHGHQAGLLLPGTEPGRVRVRVVSISWRDFIPACGGLTQVLGHALVHTEVASWVGLTARVPPWDVTLEFDAWPVPLRIRAAGKGGVRVESDLSAFVSQCRQQHVGPVTLEGVPAWQVGTFLVLDADVVRERLPEADVDTLDGPSRMRLLGLHHTFQQLTGRESWDFCLYDWAATGDRDVRVVFPHALPIDHVEPACGTGSVALVTALVESGAAARNGFPPRDGELTLRLETGGAPVLGGPETTRVSVTVRHATVQVARFTHSNVSLTAAGVLHGL
jgi:proline racemase